LSRFPVWSVTMNRNPSPLYWSLSAGTWFAVRVRISVLLPLVLLALLFQLPSWSLAVVFTGVLVASVAAHEFGHVMAARRTGGAAEEILLWPLGGLAMVQPADRLSSRVWTAAGGLLVNLVVCLASLPIVWQAGHLAELLNPLNGVPDVALAGPATAVLVDLTQLVFVVNWWLLLFNLLPVFPFDGGRLLQAWLAHWFLGSASTVVYVRIGSMVGFVLLVLGVIVDGPSINGTWIVVLGALVLVLNVQEAFGLQRGESEEGAFLGYDFSAGYTSLERDEPAERRPGLLRRLRQRLHKARVRRVENRIEEVEDDVDSLLEKVHSIGYDGLSNSEKRQLARASAEYRSRTLKSE